MEHRPYYPQCLAIKVTRQSSGLSQRAVAEAMIRLGHRTWTKGTVSFLEQARRTLHGAEEADLLAVLGASDWARVEEV